MRPFALALCLLLATTPVLAEGDAYGNGLAKDFFDNLSIPGLVPNCCNDADCKRTRADFVDGHWVAESRMWADKGYLGEWVVIPDNRVTKRQSPFDAVAVVCEGDGLNSVNTELKTSTGKTVYLYCMAPPPIGF